MVLASRGMKTRALSMSVCSLLLSCGSPSKPAEAPQGPHVLMVTDAMGNPHPGDAAPDFDLVDQDGKHVSLASLKGSWVMLAFVTSWCPFSKAEQPNLAKLATDYSPKGIKVISIDIAEQDVNY